MTNTQIFSRFTKRIYNNHPLLTCAKAKIIKIGADYIELDQTIAYAEGGGQEPDFGTIRTDNGISLSFYNVQKIYTSPVILADFPEIQANGVIWHYINEEDKSKLSDLQEGQEIIINIDIERRAKLSISHSASHVLYMAVQMHRPEAVNHIFGCHIKPQGARFDFYTDKFTEQDIKNIAQSCHEIIENNYTILNQAHTQNDDARYWICNNIVIPCGGTHIEHTNIIGEMQIKRKGLGAGKERLSCTFEKANTQKQISYMINYTSTYTSAHTSSNSLEIS
jgi:Ser-tRNA(Ala) deacylase AlaX